MTHTNNLPDSIKAYLALAEARPELFAPSEEIPIVLDGQQIYEFSLSHNRPMGVVYSNLPFYIVVADLCRGKLGLYAYSRVLYPNPSNGSVAIPVCGNKFGLLRCFRHAPRVECLEFPRGFADANLTPEENIRKELMEEMGAVATQIVPLGKVRADTGLSAGCADVFLAEVSQAKAQIGEEGIRELLWLTSDELYDKIRAGEITDGFTLSALTLLYSYNRKPP